MALIWKVCLAAAFLIVTVHYAAHAIEAVKEAVSAFNQDGSDAAKR